MSSYDLLAKEPEPNQYSVKLSGLIPLELAGKRLDQALASIYSDYSRADLKRWILEGACLIDHKILPPKYKVKGGETLQIQANLPVRNLAWMPEALPLKILYEDEAILIIDKPSGLVVHPGAGNWHGTLLNALLHYSPALAIIPRAGIIHRLDQDTTGVMLIAKTLTAYNYLLPQFSQRTVKKIYTAVVIGNLIAGGTIDLPIGRHPKNRLKMAVTCPATGKSAITSYKILQKFSNHTYLTVELKTGRTHQIRVHMHHIGHPLVGDRLYAAGYANNLFNTFPRQALHAQSLTFKHPVQQQMVTFNSEPPADLIDLLHTLAG